MCILSYIHFFCAIIYFVMAVFIIRLNSRAIENRFLSAEMACFFVWSMASTFVDTPHASLETARIADTIGSFGWLFFSGFFVLFALAFSGKHAWVRKPAVWFALFTLPLVLFVQQFRGKLFTGHQLTPFGWSGQWAPGAWPVLYFITYTATTVTGLLLLLRLALDRTTAALKRKQSWIMVVSAVVALVLGTIVNVALPVLLKRQIPTIADMLVMIWAVAVFMAIWQFRLLTITPTIAAREIISYMTDFLFLLDQEGRIVQVNPAVVRTLGYDETALKGRELTDLMNAYDTGIVPAQVVLRHTSQKEIRLVSTSGETIPVSISSSVIPGIGIVCVARDISQQKRVQKTLEQMKTRLEEQVASRTRQLTRTNEELVKEMENRKSAESGLRESEERFRTLFEYAPDAYYMNDLTGNFIDGNRRAEQIIGMKRVELIGKNFLHMNLLSPAQLPKAAALLSKSLLGLPTGPDEFVLRKPDGETVAVEISTCPLKLKDRTIVLGAARDVTARRQADEENRQLETQLIQAHKMEAVGRLAGGIAHDFNNMLGAIAGYADMIKRKTADDRTLHKYSSGILDAAMRAADLTAKLLTFARKGSIETVPVDLNTVVREALGLLEHTMDKSIRIDCRLYDGEIPVLGDRAQIQNAILNLCINSRDAMPGGGTLVVSTMIVDLDDDFQKRRVYKIIPGKHGLIQVQDTGTGMPPEVKAHAFEPFFTTKEIGKGTGLGLASVYGTVKSHNGYVDIDSEPGTGTTVRMYLPLMDETHTGPAPEEAADIRKGRGRIMVIDDEEPVRDVCSELARYLGYTPVPFSTGEEAVSWFGRHTADVTAVILDVQMPGLTGGQVLTQLKKIDARVPVIVTTGYNIGMDTQALLKDASFYLQKPFDLQKLSDAISAVMGPG